MGSPTNEEDREPFYPLVVEGPQTAVTISKGFWMGKYEVTQGEYLAVIGTNPSHFNGDRSGDPPPFNQNYGTNLTRPVEQVAWFNATNYCGKLTQRERAAGRIATNSVYRLPTEAEWEYACRAWTSTRFSYGDDPGYTDLNNYAWYTNNSSNVTYPVGQKLPNSWGLYDMLGNVVEWCQDWYAPYPGGIALDPRGPATGSTRIARGGLWLRPGSYCRSAWRNAVAPDFAGAAGFRVVLAPGQP
jgi:formylglycine-generating enzyme required for sulfatase activity